MKYWLAAALVAAALAAGAARHSTAPPSSSSKPDSPLLVTVRLAGDPHANATCGVVVDVTPLSDGDVTVDVALPEGFTFVRGDRSLQAPLRRGQARQLRFDVHVAHTQRREIVATATLAQGTARLTSVSTLVVNDDGSAPAPGGERKTDARGRAIREYKEP